MSGISFRFFDSVPLIFLNQSLFDEFQGITLIIVSMPAKLSKYDLSHFPIVCWTVVRESLFCACILAF